MIDLNKMTKEAYKVAETREENGASIKTDTLSMLKHCATEVVEATNAFDEWQTDLRFGIMSMGVTDPDWQHNYKKEFADELADIITCVLIIAGHNGIDIEQALKDVQEKNKARAEGRGDKK